MYKYKNVSNQDQIVPGVGEVKAGGEIEAHAPIENPNFEFVSQTNNQGVVGTEAQQPNAVVEAERVAGTEGLEVK